MMRDPDPYKKREQNLIRLEEIRQLEGIGRPLSALSADEFHALAAISGIDPGEVGF